MKDSDTGPILRNVKTYTPSSAEEDERSQIPSAKSPSIVLARQLRKKAPVFTETYIAYGGTEVMLKECARQADYSIPQSEQRNAEIPKSKDGEDLGVGTGWWYEELGLTPTFNNWAQVTFLHMYLITTRIRCFPPELAPVWHQHLIDHFSFAAEERMVKLHNIPSRSKRNGYLKDLYVQWRGLTAAYDEGMVSGDSVLAAAVWRNIFKANEEVDFRKLGMVVAYMRSAFNALDGISDEALAAGDILFGDPGSEEALVKVRSKMMDIPFDSDGSVAK